MNLAKALKEDSPHLKRALDAYWGAKSRREEQAAYHEILLFGGPDGYPVASPWRCWVARQLRKVALWVEGR
jgi:hypothetical protein